jgi:hypothetical protein
MNIKKYLLLSFLFMSHICYGCAHNDHLTDRYFLTNQAIDYLERLTDTTEKILRDAHNNIAELTLFEQWIQKKLAIASAQKKWALRNKSQLQCEWQHIYKATQAIRQIAQIAQQTKIDRVKIMTQIQWVVTTEEAHAALEKIGKLQRPLYKESHTAVLTLEKQINYLRLNRCPVHTPPFELYQQPTTVYTNKQSVTPPPTLMSPPATQTKFNFTPAITSLGIRHRCSDENSPTKHLKKELTAVAIR